MNDNMLPANRPDIFRGMCICKVFSRTKERYYLRSLPWRSLAKILQRASKPRRRRELAPTDRSTDRLKISTRETRDKFASHCSRLRERVERRNPEMPLYSHLPRVIHFFVFARAADEFPALYESEPASQPASGQHGCAKKYITGAHANRHGA